MTRRPRWFTVTATIVAAVATAVLAWVLIADPSLRSIATEDGTPFRIAEPTDPADALLWLALHDDAFRDAGAVVEIVAIEHGESVDDAALDDVRAARVDLAAVGLTAFAREFATRDGRIADDDPTILAAIAHVADPAPATSLAPRVVVARRGDVARAPERYARLLNALDATLDATLGGTAPLTVDLSHRSGLDPDEAGARYRATTFELSLEWNVLAALLAAGDAFRADGRPAWPKDGPILVAFDPRPLEHAASPAPIFPWLPPVAAGTAP